MEDDTAKGLREVFRSIDHDSRSRSPASRAEMSSANSAPAAPGDETEQAPETSTEADKAAVLGVLVEKALIVGQHVSQESLIVHFEFAEKPPRSRATVETAMQQLAESGAVELGGRPPACSLTLAGLLQSPYGDEARKNISAIIAALRTLSVQNPRPTQLRWVDLQAQVTSLGAADYNLVRLTGTLSFLFWSAMTFHRVPDDAALREVSFGVPPDLLDVVLLKNATDFLAYRERTPPILATLRSGWQGTLSRRGVRLAIDEIYEHMRREGQWPLAKSTDRSLARRAGVRLRDLHDTPFFRGAETNGDDVRTRLTLEGVLARAEPLDDTMIAATLRLLAVEYRDRDTEETSAIDLLARIQSEMPDVRENDLRRCLAFLEHEVGVFINSNATKDESAIARIRVSVTSDILDYCNVRNLTDVVCATKERQGRYWRAGVQVPTSQERNDEPPNFTVNSHTIEQDEKDNERITIAAQQPESPPVPDKFLVGDKLGAGVFGDVWRAKDKELRRDVAIKFIRSTGATRNDVLEHARALARVSHASIVAVYEVTRTRDPVTDTVTDAVVMELIDGVVLRERLCRAVDLADATRIGIALIDAVEQYHENHIAHMDLHDGNVIVGVDSVKVLDPLYLDTALFSSTATREVHQRRELRALRDLICQVLDVTEGMAFAAISEFRRHDGRAGVADIRRAFETVLASAAQASPPLMSPGAPIVPEDEFDEALARGQAAHEHAIRAKAEINDVLGRLSRAVMARTDGKVSVRLGVKRARQVGHDILTFMTTFTSGEITGDVVYDTLYACRENGRADYRMPLCSVSIDGFGYPVTLTRGDVVRQADSKGALVAALRGLVTDPDVWGKITRVREISIVVQKTLPPAEGKRVIDVASSTSTLLSDGDSTSNEGAHGNEDADDA